MGGQRVVDGAGCRILPLASFLKDRISGAVNQICVIPRSTDQRVGSRSAIEDIG